MARKRARLADNDPLNLSNAVLDPIEEDNQSTSQQDDTTASQPAQSTPSPVKKPTSQQDDKSTVELKKATFQIDKAVLTKLERFVLSLQLELGKENAPYKEVVVEEAIERLLATDQAKLLKALDRRQRKRKNQEEQATS